jgi:serine/threonine-protein kinase HipA
MDKLSVYADYNWLEKEELVGTLYHDRLRGADKYGFEYNASWLKNHPDIVLSADIMNYSNIQWAQQGKDIFGCFSDAMPNRWGRTLLMRREQILAKEESRPVKKLTSYDYLLGINDSTRMGALRFKTDDDNYLNADKDLSVPPVTDIRDLLLASEEIERSEERNMLPEAKWLQQLINPGSSLGGARPKANVTNNGNLYIAKFPSRKDNYDVELWEHLCHLLAKEAGINVAETKLLNTGGKYHTLLSKRFDRQSSKRIHFASAMTMLGLSDGCDANTGNGYLDIVDFIMQSCVNVESNLKELFRRVAFFIRIGNSDDHFRNHGFILTREGWTLSPAYDINPTTSDYQSLLINRDSNESSLDLLLDASEDYMISHDAACSIINEVEEAVSTWRSIATRLQIPKSEMEMFADKFHPR